MGIKKDFGNINMELLDVLDENGNLTGEKMERGKVHELGIWHRCVHIWIINSKGELLLQKRGSWLNHFPGLLDASAAGHVSAGETREVAAIKEVSEELGIEIPIEDFILLKEIQVTKGTKNHFDSIYLIKKDLEVDKLKLQEDEVAGVELLHWREFKKKLKDNPEMFTPREEEFEILFEYLENNSL